MGVLLVFPPLIGIPLCPADSLDLSLEEAGLVPMASLIAELASDHGVSSPIEPHLALVRS